jgi:DNA polymerase I
VENAYRTGQAVNILGRVRRLPGLYSHDHEARSGAERIAINSPIQGFASDLMQMAIASISGRLPGFPPVPDAHIVLTVHDNIGIEVPLDPVRGRKAILECRKRMEEIANVMFVKMECRFDIPLVVDIKAGSRWSLNDLYELFFPDE